jgi:predicted nucleic acid-binding protein
LAKPLSDTDDESFLEVAIGGNVDALVTGNKRHFSAAAAGPIKIFSPTEFLRYFYKASL